MTLSYKQYLDGTRQILEKSKAEKTQYLTSVVGREFIVCLNVFSPKYFRDTELFAQHLPVHFGEEMLEIGPGTGAIAVTAAHRGACKVVAVDINPYAVLNTQMNIALHRMEEKVEVRHGNLYDPLRSGEKFDVIFWNTPFGFVEDDNLSDLEKAVYDPLYRSTERFIKESNQYLKENGRVLIGFSTTLGRLDLPQEFCYEAGLTLRLVYETWSHETHPVKFEILEATSRNS